MSDLDCCTCLCVGLCGLICSTCASPGGSYICMPCCRGRSYEDSVDEVDRLDMSDRDVVVPVRTVQQEPAFNAQPSKTGQMNPNLGNTEVMPTR